MQVVERLLAELRTGFTGCVTLDSSLERDLGLDSLARGELLLRVETAFGVALPEGTLGQAQTPADLLAALRRASPGHAAPKELAQEAWRTEDVALPIAAETLNEVLQWHAERWPAREHILFHAASDRTERLCYGDLLGSARRVASGLRNLDLPQSATVAIMLPTSLDFFTAFFGVLLAGGVPVPLYPPASLARIEEHLRRQVGILNSAQAVVMITVAEAKPLARLLDAQVDSLTRVVTVAEVVAIGHSSAPTVVPAAADLALLQYTSGSTGNPKGVALTHANLLANIRAWSTATRLSPADVCVSWLPLYHDMGLIGAWLGSLYNACHLVLMSPLTFLARPEEWLWAIHRYRGTVTAAPNFAFELCLRRLEHADLSGLDLSSWRLAANGAEPVSPATVDRFCNAFAAYGLRREVLLPVYGLAECAVGLAVPVLGRPARIDRVRREDLASAGQARPALPDDRHALRFVSCGRALPGHEMRVVDDADRELPERHVGHLQFRGPSTTAGYFRNPEANRRLFHDTWLDSGDLAYMADGEVFFTGRVKDMIIRGGRNLYPYELEEAIGRQEGVRRGCVAVFSAPDEVSGSERLVAVAETRIVDASARAALQQRLHAIALEVLGEPADEILLAAPGSLLKTSSGKLRRAAIRDLYLGGKLGVARRAPYWQIATVFAEGARAWLGRRIRRFLELVYGAWFWGLLGLLAIPVWPLVALLRNPRRGWAISHLAARALLRGCGIAPRVAGSENLAGPGPVVVACNHASYLDGVVLVAVLRRPALFVAKRELGRQFIAGNFLRGLGAIFVERFEVERSIQDAGRCAEALRAGQSMVFFPEGTFTRQSGLRPFHLGAFVAAASSGVPIVPMALHGSREILRDESWLPRRGAIEITVCAPLAAGAADWDAAVRLRDAVRARILDACREADLAL